MTGRRRAPLGLLPALVIATAWLLVPATAAAGDPCYHGFEIPPVETAATTTVTLEPCAFSPTIARVPVGATVTFANGDVPHLITGANQGWGDRDVEIQPGSKVSYSFDTPGIYPYACALHRGMSGAILVGDVGQAAAAAPVAAPTSGTGDPATIVAVGVLAAVLVGGVLAFALLRRRGPVAVEPAVNAADTPLR